ncbi:MAG TPA: hypothetical protein VFW96_27435 [Thermomicrobiales bacterium]|nr:hypothetical protein [Thermomicrobiales bacterium]
MSANEQTYTIRDYVAALSPEEQGRITVAEIALRIADAARQARAAGRAQLTIDLSDLPASVTRAALEPYLRELGYQSRPIARAGAEKPLLRVREQGRHRGRFSRPRRERGSPGRS